VFLAVVVGGVIDLILDRPENLFSAHVLFEVGLIALSIGAASYLAMKWYATAGEVRTLENAVEMHRAERDAWKDRAGRVLAGFGEAISAQFDAWGLTPAESETALLLLKGHSHKRIAHATDRSERTVRQHAVAVYRKAGLRSRAELAAFFLEDLLLPADGESERRDGEAG
jgi:DNA-binding NarL/FixJ family response regulator